MKRISAAPAVKIIMTLLFAVLFLKPLSTSGQQKGNSAYSKAEKLQKLLDLSDVQKSRVVSILMSSSYGNPMANDGASKAKVNFGNHLNEINMAIDQILTIEQQAKFNQIRSNWITMKAGKKDSGEDKAERKDKSEKKKEKKNKKDKENDGGEE